MVAVYRHDVAGTIMPLTVEARLEAVVPWAPRILLSGQSDVVALDPDGLCDTKAGSKLGNYGPQIGGYSLLNKAAGNAVRIAQIHFVQRVHISSRTKIQTQPRVVSRRRDVALDETAAASILSHIDRGIQLFREGDPERGFVPGDPWAFPANPSSMLCSEKYCSACRTSWCHEADFKE
jgi:hypothetical protein